MKRGTMTVAALMKELRHYPKKATVRIAAEPILVTKGYIDTFDILSVYLLDDKRVAWIDIEPDWNEN